VSDLNEMKSEKGTREMAVATLDPQTDSQSPDAVGYYPGQHVPYGAWVNLIALEPWEGNPECRSLDDVPMKRLRESLLTYGQVQPASTLNYGRNGRSTVWDGNRRYRAAHELGWDRLWVVSRDLKPEVSEATLAVVANSTVRPWASQEIVQAVDRHPEVLTFAPKAIQGSVARLQAALNPTEYRAFARDFGVRAARMAARVERYIGGERDDDLYATILHYFMAVSGGAKRVEDAMRLGIDATRLRDLIESGKPITPRW
jgi:hypothetical protein